MSLMPLRVTAWNFWSPTGTDPLHWLSHIGEEDETVTAAAPARSVPPLQRRRMSRLARMALEVATEIPGGTTADYCVFCSRHGEIQRTDSILEDLASGIEPSPTDFAMSVHNTSVGLYSIVCQMHVPSTSICAGELTFLAGWIEAAAWLAEHPGHSVLLVMFDEGVPPMLRSDVQHATRDYAMALLLAGGGPGIVLERDIGNVGPAHTVGPHFLAWWLSGECEFAVCVERQGWRWRRDD